MPHECNHAHGHKHADGWTNIASAVEMVSSFISDAYWLANLLDTLANLEPDLLRLSYYGITIGAILALVSASGAAYSHRALNTIHQSTANPADAELDEKVAEKKQLNPKVHHSLTLVEKLALIGDFISHVGDLAGPLTFVAILVAHETLPRWGKLITQAGALFVGSIGSVANVRSCRDAIIASKTEPRAMTARAVSFNFH